MSSPILVIDHGSAVAKACLIKGDEFAFFHIPLGFKPSGHFSVAESISYIINQVERHANIKILSQEKKVKFPVYVSGDIASTELEKVLENLPISAIDALSQLNMGVIDVGHEFTYVRFSKESSPVVSRKKIEAEKIVSWLAFDISLIWVKNYLLNKDLYPQTVPASVRELRLEQALAKERIADAISSVDLSQGEILQGELDLLATGGVLVYAPRREQVVSMVLDGLKPAKTLRIYLDEKQLAPCLGTLKHFEPKEGEKLTRLIDFECLATVVTVPVGSSLKIDFGLKNIQEVRIKESELLLFPLEKSKQAEITVETPESGEFTSKVEGGHVGLVVDARGRPLERPTASSKNRELLLSWEKALNVHGRRAEL